MSYEIIDGRQFIKTTRGVLPLILGGSNNCTMYYGGREIRERSWFLMCGQNWLECSERDLLGKAEDMFGGADLSREEGTKYGGKWLNGADFLTFIERGMKYAKTIEEVRELCPNQSLSCHVSYYVEDGESWASDLRENICETDKLEAWIDAARELEKSLYMDNNIKYVGINISFQGIAPLNIERAVQRNRAAGPVIAKMKSRYVTDATKNSISYSVRIEDAMVFPCVDEAMDQLPRAFGPYRFVSAGAKDMAKAKNTVLIVKSGFRTGYYIKSLSRSRLYFASRKQDAKRFSTEKAAMKWAEEHIGVRFAPGITSVAAEMLKPAVLSVAEA